MKLEELLRDFAIYPPAMVEARRRSQQARLLAESRKPMSGPYYWIPEKTAPENSKPGWQLYSFFEDEYGDMPHIGVWEKYLCRTLGLTGDARNAYLGLPRGRVANLSGKHGRMINWVGKPFVIFHGNDTPGGSRGIKQVAREFNLPHNMWEARFDEHEQRDPEHFELIRAALGYKQKTKRVPKLSQGDIYGYGYDDEEAVGGW